MSKDLNAQNARIFRITHRDNLRWILANGLHCASANRRDPGFVAIGNADLISKRAHRALPPPYGGLLSDYVPFYFTPFSPMMLNIKTGWGGIKKQQNEDVLIIVSSIWKLVDEKVPFVFSDRHAYLQAAQFYNDPQRLDQIDWDILQRRDFKRDGNDPGKFERYEAEALARGHVPVSAILGIGCFNEAASIRLKADVDSAGSSIASAVRPGWYFV